LQAVENETGEDELKDGRTCGDGAEGEAGSQRRAQRQASREIMKQKKKEKLKRK
jgi:hypothetical protein